MNADNFLLNTDYPMDKLVYLDEVNWTSYLEGGEITTIPHGLGSTPFMNGVCSADGWNTTYSSGTTVQEGQIYTKMFGIGSDSNNIYICGYLDYYATVTAKVRMWGVFDDSVSQNVSADYTQGVRAFKVNSDYNYPRLFAEGTVDASSEEINVNHNLGFVPYLDLWIERQYNGITMWLPASFATGYINILEQPFPTTVALAPYIDSNKLTLRNGKFHYRIYNDKAI